MKYVRESLKEFNDYKFFKLFEEEKGGLDKETLKSKEKDGLAIIDKITKNFDEFKKDAKDEILRYKEFWEENQETKKGFTETGSMYKMFNSDYAVGVFELPPTTLSDGSIEGGLGASEDPEEEIIEGKELMEAEEGDDLDLDLNLDDLSPAEPAGQAPKQRTGDQPEEVLPAEKSTEELPDEGTEETPEELPEEEPEDSEDSEETQRDLSSPQTYFVVYDISGDEREEIFRCGSNNVVSAFNSFYNDTFKGSMKDIIMQYQKQKETEKTEAEKSEKSKKETEKQNKVKKFLSESTYEEEIDNDFLEDVDLDDDFDNDYLDNEDFDEEDSDDDYLDDEDLDEEDSDDENFRDIDFEDDVFNPDGTLRESKKEDKKKKKEDEENHGYQLYDEDIDDFEKEQSLWDYLMKKKKTKGYVEADEEASVWQYLKSRKKSKPKSE